MVMMVMILEGERSFAKRDPFIAAAAFALLISNPFLAGHGKVQFQKIGDLLNGGVRQHNSSLLSFPRGLFTHTVARG